MSRPGITFTYSADVALPPRRLVRHGVADNRVTLATDGAAPILGVTEQIPVALNGSVDVIHGEVAMVEAGGPVARSSPVTADGIGRAIVAAPAAGVNMWSGGIALEAATAAGDQFRMLVVPQRLQG